MRGIRTTTLGFFTLPQLVIAKGPPAPPAPSSVLSPPTNSAGSPAGQSTTSKASTTIIVSVVTPTSSPQEVTTTQTVEISSIIILSTSSISSTTSIFAGSWADSTPSSSLSISYMPMASGVTGEDSQNGHRILIIVLSAVLGFVGLVLILGCLCLTYRYRQKQCPFNHRGASPIGDDEIASWRRNIMDQKRAPPPAHLAPAKPECSLIVGGPPTWTWAASPTSVRTAMSPSGFPDSPSFLAKAPNSRAGLTDDTVPGADPFIAPIKRQSSRLSKPPPGHIRTKSGRSSMSAKSVGSVKWQNQPRGSTESKGSQFLWFDPDDFATSPTRVDRTSSSIGTSVFDGLSMGGLSPRPQPKNGVPERYNTTAIGTAIG